MPSEDFKLSHAAVRVLADLTGIHICMIAALAITVFHPSLVTARIPLPAGLAGVILLALGCVLALVGGRQPEYDPGYREAAAFQPTGPRR